MNLDHLQRIAETIAREAGRKLAEQAPGLREIEFLSRSDVKLQADRESEELIRARLAEETDYPVYGEELGGDAGLTGRYEPYWVVDPLDGTYNYLRGNPSCAVSIGLMRGETPVLGVIHDFTARQCYTAIVAGSLHCNGKPVRPDWAETKDQAVLATGFPAGMDTSPERMEAFIARVAPYKKVRMTGSAALAMAYVAAGIFDVYFEESIRLWDVAAGLALVQAAGGSVRMQPCRSGKPLAYDVWAGKGSFLGDD
ncbi:MAG: hypothetical protein GVY10_08140 [Verrucomicrobia bacterium]|jgi:myo-inositol-1(or 4)-monophosphatase|nr:hypothetical protein [Verrucomicrobiota bacterium]